ncbi:MAG: BCCT family transporter [Pseudomonadota bacterium]
MSSVDTARGIEPMHAAPNPVDTDFQVGQDNVQVAGFDMHQPVFLISAGLVVAFVTGTLMFPDEAGDWFGTLRTSITEQADWFFLTVGNLMVVFALMVIVTPLGTIRLGGERAQPDYGYFAWFAMLFAAGMGIGLMFYGVSEPISHYESAVAEGAGGPESWAPLAGAAGDPAAAQSLGMAATLYHWGLHPWAIYGVVALTLAFFAYNKGLPLTLRSAFYPLLGERIWGWPGHAIDTLAVFATLFGLATSLGYGAEQALSGLNYVYGLDETQTAKIGLILGITGIALISVVLGIDKGVRRLSEANMVLAALLLLFVIAVGPTVAILTGFGANIIGYAENLIPLSNPVGREDDNYRQGWTAFYWAWWIAWSPFVGTFIARVSRGRTVREFMIAVLVVPTLVSILWFTAFGGTAVSQVIEGGYQGVVDAELPVKLFVMLEQLPLTLITSTIAIGLVIVFFITSSDSGSLVIDTITAGGKVDAPVPQRMFWCTFEGLVAIALLVGGGLAGLQAAALTTGLPFAVVLLMIMVGTFLGLRDELRARPQL